MTGVQTCALPIYSNNARVSTDQRQNGKEMGVSTDTFNLRGVLASIALDQFFEAEGFVFNK